MSDEPEVLWVWQGWVGPIEEATAAKALVDADPRAGAWIPMVEDPPELLDVGGTLSAFAVLTRPADPIPCPDDMLELRPDVISRLFGV
jgi:hypothetical protein